MYRRFGGRRRFTRRLVVCAALAVTVSATSLPSAPTLVHPSGAQELDVDPRLGEATVVPPVSCTAALNQHEVVVRIARGAVIDNVQWFDVYRSVNGSRFRWRGFNDPSDNAFFDANVDASTYPNQAAMVEYGVRASASDGSTTDLLLCDTLYDQAEPTPLKAPLSCRALINDPHVHLEVKTGAPAEWATVLRQTTISGSDRRFAVSGSDLVARQRFRFIDALTHRNPQYTVTNRDRHRNESEAIPCKTIDAVQPFSCLAMVGEDDATIRFQHSGGERINPVTELYLSRDGEIPDLRGSNTLGLDEHPDQMTDRGVTTDAESGSFIRETVLQYSVRGVAATGRRSDSVPCVTRFSPSPDSLHITRCYLTADGPGRIRLNAQPLEDAFAYHVYSAVEAAEDTFIASVDSLNSTIIDISGQDKRAYYFAVPLFDIDSVGPKTPCLPAGRRS